MSKADKQDFAAFELNDLATVVVTDPITGEDTDVTITLYGQDSAVAKSASHSVQDKCADYSRRNHNKPIPSEDFAKLDRQKMIKITKSIDGLIVGGKELTDIGEIYDRFPWVLDQAVAGHLDRVRFIKASSAK